MFIIVTQKDFMVNIVTQDSEYIPKKKLCLNCVIPALSKFYLCWGLTEITLNSVFWKNWQFFSPQQVILPYIVEFRTLIISHFRTETNTIIFSSFCPAELSNILESQLFRYKESSEIFKNTQISKVRIFRNPSEC